MKLFNYKQEAFNVRIVIGTGFNKRPYPPTPPTAHLIKINKIVHCAWPYYILSSTNYYNFKSQLISISSITAPRFL
jgi:hypothetical protein